LLVSTGVHIEYCTAALLCDLFFCSADVLMVLMVSAYQSINQSINQSFNLQFLILGLIREVKQTMTGRPTYTKHSMCKLQQRTNQDRLKGPKKLL